MAHNEMMQQRYLLVMFLNFTMPFICALRVETNQNITVFIV